MVFMYVGVCIYIVSGSYKFVYGDFSTLVTLVFALSCYQFPYSAILTVCSPLAGKDDAQGEHGKMQSRAGLSGSRKVVGLVFSFISPLVKSFSDGGAIHLRVGYSAEFSISNTERSGHGWPE